MKEIIEILRGEFYGLFCGIFGCVIDSILMITLFGKKKYSYILPEMLGLRFVIYNVGLLLIANHFYGGQQWFRLMMPTIASASTFLIMFLTTFLWKEQLAKVLLGFCLCDFGGTAIVYGVPSLGFHPVVNAILSIIIFLIIYKIITPLLKKYQNYRIKHSYICSEILIVLILSGWLSNFLYVSIEDSVAAQDSELEKHFCERLYARNRYEAGLIYAFQNRISYEAWKELYQKYIEQGRNMENREEGIKKKRIFESKKQRASTYTSGIWRGEDITFKAIKDYVRKNSQNEVLETGMRTFLVEEELKHVETVEYNAGFGKFMKKNESEFSAVREKARYYFCKYLSFYIEERCQRYYEKCKEKEVAISCGKTKQELEPYKRAEQIAFAELDVLKNLSVLKAESEKIKINIPLVEKMNYVDNARLSYRTLFDRFNYFYFGFITLERAEYLYETYWEYFRELEDDRWKEHTFAFQEIWEEEMLKVANLLGVYKGSITPKRKERAFTRLAELKKRLEEKEEKLDEEYRLDALISGRQRGRGGEMYFRDFITGRRDINRDTLITFLLFVDGTTELSIEKRITKLRINTVLRNCGFAQLVPQERNFDKFISDYLGKTNRSQKIDLLYEAAQEAIERGEDFCFRKMYLPGKSNQEELLKYITESESGENL